MGGGEMKSRDVSVMTSRFGEYIFSFDVMKQRLPEESYGKLMFAIRNQRSLSMETADVIAHAMKEWAISRGATHYTHWFQPLTGLAAEKHDAFLGFDETGSPLDKFAGKELILSEPDASSFAHGGLRSTFEARGYATWDPSSPAFLMKRGERATLCLPSVFVSYKGEVLDKKTPLLRSVTAVSKAAVRMLRLLGNKRVTGVMPYVGAEQEYFLVDRELFLKRLDLGTVGATLFGGSPARGQQLEDHYFRAIGDRVLGFMEDVEEELIRLGVPVKTRHNEVAPAQFELAVAHRPVNIAADQNQLVMEILRRVAPRHGFEALLHEKPFARVNGSGKHNNWSLIDSEGTNLLIPGRNQASQLRFLIFLMSVVLGVQRHGGLLRGIIAGPGNDRRLGGQEAPPSIMSVHLGGALTALLDNLVRRKPPSSKTAEEIDLGLGGVAKIPRDTADRNRTSPLAFTGDKFELRAVGSSVAIAMPNMAINAIVAEALDDMSDRIELRVAKGEDRTRAAFHVLREVIKETEPCRFDGDSYTAEWAMEASRRGLPAAKSTPEALLAFADEATLSLFERYGLMTRDEAMARYRIRLEFYIKTVTVELAVARRMLSTEILPACLKYQKTMAESLGKTLAVLGDEEPGIELQRSHLRELTRLTSALVEAIASLEHISSVLQSLEKEQHDIALFCAERVRPAMDAAREIADRLEQIVDAAEWSLPRYDMLFRV